MSDLDAEISILESASNSTSRSFTKNLAIYGGGGLLGGISLTMLLKPMWAYKIEIDPRTGDPVTKINWMRFLLAVLIFTLISAFGLSRVI
jgi:hypothetical protein